jgi:hypothetical protein
MAAIAECRRRWFVITNGNWFSNFKRISFLFCARKEEKKKLANSAAALLIKSEWPQVAGLPDDCAGANTKLSSDAFVLPDKRNSRSKAIRLCHPFKMWAQHDVYDINLPQGATQFVDHG